MDPSETLLLEVVRSFVGTARAEDIPLRAADVRDWDRTIELADAHGLLPIACAVMREAAGDVLPPGADVRLAAEQREAVVRSLRIEAEASTVLGALVAAGVEPVVLKGIALARTLYPDTWLRPSGDLDLLVREDAWPAVRDTMLASGASPEGPDMPSLPPRLTPDDALDHYAAFTTAGGLRVEIAFDPLQLGLRMADHEGFLARAVPLPLPRTPGARMPSAEDTLLMLLVHLNRHGFGRLVWSVDVALLLRSEPDLDWERFAASCRREGVRAPAAGTLARVADALALELPAEPRAALRATAASSALWRRYWPAAPPLAEVPRLHEGPLVFRKSRGSVPRATYASWLAANLVLTGRRRAKARFLARKLLPPRTFLEARFGGGDARGGYGRLWLRRLRARTATKGPAASPRRVL